MTCPEVGNNCPKGWLIPHVVMRSFASVKPQGASGGCASGERVSNTWATCPRLWDNSKKLGLIPDMTADRMVWWWKDLSAGDGPAAYQLVGGVVAYQGDDG